MREYGAVSPQFWTGRTGRQIRKLGRDAQVVALYLLTAPGSTMLGLYYLPIGTIVHETGVPEGDVHETLADFDEMGFAHYDEANEVVWVVEMARYQIADELKVTDNRYKYVVKEAPRFAASPLYARWHDHYRAAFNLPDRKVKASPSEAPSKGGSNRFGGGDDPPSKPRQDRAGTTQDNDNPRASTPTRETHPRTEVVVVEPKQPDPSLAMIAAIVDASGGKFDGDCVGSVLQRAFTAVLSRMGVDMIDAKFMGEMAPTPNRIWPNARGLAADRVAIGWVMGKQDAEGGYNAPWVTMWVEKARSRRAACERRQNAVVPPSPAPSLPPDQTVGTPEYAARMDALRARGKAAMGASAPSPARPSQPPAAVAS